MAQKTGLLRKVTLLGASLENPVFQDSTSQTLVASPRPRRARGPERVAMWRALAGTVALRERSQPICGLGKTYKDIEELSTTTKCLCWKRVKISVIWVPASTKRREDKPKTNKRKKIIKRRDQ